MEGKTRETLEEKIARLENENAVLREAHEELLKQLTEAQFDSLTGLRRREPFMQEISDFLKISETPTPIGLEVENRKNKIEMPVISLVIFDIDFFKKVNDTFGHDAGDMVLKLVAETIQRYTREKDIAARWGGEEIILAMVGADEGEAETKANFIREKISRIVFEGYSELKVTVSAGVASSDKFNKFNNLFKAVDEALYKSKHGGRNMVTAHTKTSE